jgi:hypothetical protein
MKYFWAALGWIFSKRKFILISFFSALFFFVWFFPFDDLSDLVTSTVAQATNNQIYVQFETMDLNFIPTPAISARRVSVETPALPAIEASWLKVTPSLFGLMFHPLLLKRAAGGDPQAASELQTHIGASVAAEGVLGADIELAVGRGSKSEGGNERSKIFLEIDKLNLGEVSKWAGLSVNMQGQAGLTTTMQMTPGFTEQPEGEIELKVNKFRVPASTIMIPFGEAMMPINLPTLTLANAILKGRLVGGSLVIEDGTFGQSQDPVHGRMKGQLALRLQNMGGQVQPIFGAYNLTLDLNTSKQIEKDMGFAFILFDSAKTPTPTGSRYLFRAQGVGLGPQYPPPTITRINSL